MIREVGVVTHASLSQAARTIFTRCLSLPNGSEVLIFADETTSAVAEILALEAWQMQLKPMLLYYSLHMQKVFQNASVPTGLLSAMKDANAAMICLNGEPEYFLFRDHMRRTAWNAGLKVAHMPGITPEVLLMADLDYEQLSYQCELFALALAKGTRLEIVSYDSQGKAHRLSARLDPWNRFPIVSDGIIEARVWGNVPSGETYISPPEGQAEGEIVINGSMPQFLIAPGQEIILRFEQGRLVDWNPKDNATAEYLQKSIIELAEKQGDFELVESGRDWSGCKPSDLRADRESAAG